MKKVILVTVISVLLAGGTAFGEMKGNKACSKVAGMATTIMKARQRGAPMSKVMSATVKTISNPKVENLLRSLIIEAYSLPNYSSSKYEKRAVRKFENKVYLECIKEASN